MRLFSNRSQRTPKCGKNISDTLGCASCATFLFIRHFDVICDLLLNRRTATWNLFIKYKQVNKLMTKGLITWWISARAEISLRLPGWNIVAITWSISAWAQNANFREKVYWGAKTHRYACSRSFFSPGWKNDSDYMDFSARLAGLKILARFENTRLGFSARAELCPGLNPSPCNRQLGFLRICFRSRSEISTRLAGLKLTM